MKTIATCIGCGCDDNHACPFGCFWLRVDYDDRNGVCSECAEHVNAWDIGDRTPRAVPAAEAEQDPGEQITPPTAADLAPKLLPDGRCDHNWPRMMVRDADQCTRCGMTFIHYAFTECP